MRISDWSSDVCSSDLGTPLVLHPQARTFTAPVTETTEAAIDTLWDGQLYAVLGKPHGEGRWQVHIWWKPFVTLIWAGGLLIALGGIIALVGRLWRARRYARCPPLSSRAAFRSACRLRPFCWSFWWWCSFWAVRRRW